MSGTQKKGQQLFQFKSKYVRTDQNTFFFAHHFFRYRFSNNDVDQLELF